MFARSRRFQLFKNPSFTWYVAACFILNFGSGLSIVAMTWLMLKADNSVAALAIMMLCFWLPTVLLGPLMGVLVDRYSRKWVLIVSNTMRGVVLLAFGWYLGQHLSAVAIDLLMLSLGVCFSINMPANMALVREIVSQEDLLYANSSVDIAYEVGNVAGMGIAGFFMVWFSAAATLYANGILFVVSSVFLMMVRVPFQPVIKSLSMLNIVADFRSGFDYLMNNKKALVVYMVQLMIMVSFMVVPVLFAPYAKNILHTTVQQFGEIDATLSVGVVLGGFLIPTIANRLGWFVSVLVLCIILSVFFMLFGWNRSIPLAAFLYFIIGFALAVWPLVMTKAQDCTAIDFQGRVQSLFNSLCGVITLAIYLMVEFASNYLGVQALYMFPVILAAMAAFLVYWYRAEIID